LPRQVPPLVASHMLMPTARNKMHNAIIKHQNFGEEWTEVTTAPLEAEQICRNWKRLDEMLDGAALSEREISVIVQGERFKFGIVTGRVPADRMLNFLKAYEWRRDVPNRLQREIEFLQGTGENSPGIDDWLFLAPQKANHQVGLPISREKFSVFQRSQNSEDGRFKAYTEFRHRALAEYCTLGRLKNGGDRTVVVEAGNISDISRGRQGVLLFYTVEPTKGEKRLQPGFALFFPGNGIRAPITFCLAFEVGSLVNKTASRPGRLSFRAQLVFARSCGSMEPE